jgi:hypothetical protein
LQVIVDAGSRYVSQGELNRGATDSQARALGNSSIAASKAIATYQGLSGSIKSQIKSIQDKTTATDADTTATQETTAQTDALSKAMSVASNIGGILSDTLDGLSGNAVDAAKQEDEFRHSLAGITAVVKTSGKAIDDSTTGGRANKEMVLGMISAANQHAEAVCHCGARC